MTTSEPMLEPFATEHFDQHPSAGVRASSTKLRTYQLVVIASDVADLVRSAGGWMCDRVRAGWRVNALIPGDSEIRPLQILGVRALSFESEYQVLRTSSPAAFAVASDAIERDERIRRDIQSALMRGTAEVTVWGKPSQDDLDCRMEARHRLSGAARAFKAQALIAMSPACPVVGATEEFRSAAMWYPPNGTDLAPIV